MLEGLGQFIGGGRYRRRSIPEAGSAKFRRAAAQRLRRKKCLDGAWRKSVDRAWRKTCRIAFPFVRCLCLFRPHPLEDGFSNSSRQRDAHASASMFHASFVWGRSCTEPSSTRAHFLAGGFLMGGYADGRIWRAARKGSQPKRAARGEAPSEIQTGGIRAEPLRRHRGPARSFAKDQDFSAMPSERRSCTD